MAHYPPPLFRHARTRGAVTISDEDEQPWPRATRSELNDEETAQTAIEHALRFSLAGVQMKFSAIMNARGGLTYDFVSTIPYIPGDKSALTFSRSKAYTDYTLDELGHLAAKAALPRKLVIDTAQETVALFMQRWAGEKHHLPMDSAVRRAIDKHLESLPIVTAS